MMSRALYRLGRLAARRPWAVIGTWLALTLFVIGGSAAFGQKLEDSFGAPGLDSQKAADLLGEAGSDRAGLTAQVVLTPRDGVVTFLDSPGAREALADIQEAVAELPHVVGTSDPVGVLARGAEAAAASGTVSADGRVALIRVQYPPVEELDKRDLHNLKQVGEAATDSSLRVEMGGDLFFAFEEPPAGLAELVGLLAAAVILLVAFGSLTAVGLSIGTALIGLAVGVTSLSLLAWLFEVPAWVPVLGSMVGLGVGIDYALFLLSRHREFLADGCTVEESAGRALATAGQAVIFAGGTVVIAILGLAVAGIPFVTAGGVAIAVIVTVMVAASLTLLPALLGLAGHRVNRRRLRSRTVPRDAAWSGWSRWGRHVSRHAWSYLIAGTVLLLALAAPVLALRVGNPDDGSMPESRTERRAYDLVADGFGPGRNGPLVVAVDTARDPAVVQSLARAVAADRGIASVTPPERNDEAGVAVFVAYPTTGPQDDASVDTIRRLRSEVFPSVLGSSPARAHIGGQTASFADLGERVRTRLPWLIGAVVALSFVLLTVVFRSLLVPLKAAVLNLLSIGAAYGVMVMVFQWGWAADVIGLESTVPIISFIPLFMFAILFGLSTDYEVFLLSRVREAYLATGDNTESVVHGLASTARVITSAALIMISVFLSFVLGDDPFVKMFGLGLATAVFLDATVVRMVLVPAAMKLIGDANWWLPGWLDRLLPPIGIEAHDRSPRPSATSSDRRPLGQRV